MAEQGNVQGWQPDPFGLHEKRYYSDGRPTKLVRDGDAESYDEPPTEDSAPPSVDEAAADQVDADARDEAPAVAARIPEVEPAGVTVAADTAATLTTAEQSSVPPDADIMSLPGLAILRRQPRGVLYAAVAVAAVVVVLAIIAITGGFSSHPKPGTFGALAQSGSNQGAQAPPPFDSAAAAVVTASARKTLDQKTADVTLAGTAGGAGVALPLHGAGQIDFSRYAISASLGATYHGSAIAENEIATSSNIYLQLALGGHNQIVQSTGRHWITMPLSQGTDLSQNITAYSLPWSLQLLAQQPQGVTSIGKKSINGVECTGYRVTPSKQGLVTVVQQEWARLGLPAKDRGSAMRALQNEIAAPITAWFDPHRQLACEMTVDMQLTSATPSAWSKQPTAAITQMTVDFTHYGAPVRITPPARSDSVLF